MIELSWSLFQPNLWFNMTKLCLEKEEERELIETNQILVRRLDSPYALAQVVKNGDRHAKILAAHNPKTPISTLAQLAKDSDTVIQSYVSNNPSLPPDILL